MRAIRRAVESGGLDGVAAAFPIAALETAEV